MNTQTPATTPTTPNTRLTPQRTVESPYLDLNEAAAYLSLPTLLSHFWSSSYRTAIRCGGALHSRNSVIWSVRFCGLLRSGGPALPSDQIHRTPPLLPPDGLPVRSVTFASRGPIVSDERLFCRDDAE